MTLLCIKRQRKMCCTFSDSLRSMLSSVSKIIRSKLLYSYVKIQNVFLLLSLRRDGLVFAKAQISDLNSINKNELSSVHPYLQHNSNDEDTNSKSIYSFVSISIINICFKYPVSVLSKSLGYLVKMYENEGVLFARILINNSPTENIKKINYLTSELYRLPLIYLNYLDSKIWNVLLSSYEEIKNYLKIVRKNFDYKSILFAMSFI